MTECLDSSVMDDDGEQNDKIVLKIPTFVLEQSS